MHLALFCTEAGMHAGGWRHPDAGAVRPFDLGFYRELALKAEAAKLDMLFVADKLGLDDLYGGGVAATVARRPNARPEPLTLIAALAGATDRIGLGATVSTSYAEPYHVARMVATIDHLSGGRAAWNAVTSVSDSEARNFGRAAHLDHASRYERADEFIDVVRKLWDSWEEDAIRPDKESGRFADDRRVHYIDHEGRHFRVRGPLNVERPPQGHPVVIQAGVSGTFQDIATRQADLVFTVQPDLDGAKRAYAAFKAQVAANGRSPGSVKVLPGIMPIVGRSDAEAEDIRAELRDLIDPVAGLTFMSGSMNYDLSRHPLDGPFPDLRDVITGSRGRFQRVIADALERGATVAEVGAAYVESLSFAVAAGSPKTVADTLERWVTEQAADGFVLMPTYLPGGVDGFLTQVVPELQRRGLFRREYSGATLRDHLGLDRPASRYA
ncbi:LLM class flavin-dependent oxidoreductase [Azospirillum sp. TSH64]|uniref:LLM class flavin-dependent oxidoreductase n=1 Tax=Azospirillum sp. TSH64 TaxID=652740 RepID=UPI000D603C2C|nr:LLM class flavin-dependent oxidoreductase [Azospirillum sp. TSH64]PWC74142.1 nitrilotriacetate monooxygenase [Azospirillum sp. TSH64]